VLSCGDGGADIIINYHSPTSYMNIFDQSFDRWSDGALAGTRYPRPLELLLLQVSYGYGRMGVIVMICVSLCTDLECTSSGNLRCVRVVLHCTALGRE